MSLLCRRLARCAFVCATVTSFGRSRGCVAGRVVVQPSLAVVVIVTSVERSVRARDEGRAKTSHVVARSRDALVGPPTSWVPPLVAPSPSQIPPFHGPTSLSRGEGHRGACAPWWGARWGSEVVVVVVEGKGE
jgi:hypothetical protein